MPDVQKRVYEDVGRRGHLHMRDGQKWPPAILAMRQVVKLAEEMAELILAVEAKPSIFYNGLVEAAEKMAIAARSNFRSVEWWENVIVDWEAGDIKGIPEMQKEWDPIKEELADVGVAAYMLAAAINQADEFDLEQAVLTKVEADIVRGVAEYGSV